MNSSIFCPVCHSSGLVEVTFPTRESLHDHLETSHLYLKCVACHVTVYVSPDSLDLHNAKFHGKRKCRGDSYEENNKYIKYINNDDDVSGEGDEIMTEHSYISTNSLTQGDYCKPSRFSKDPLRGFFLQTVLECKACQQTPTKKFSTTNAWQLHIKTFHKHIKTIGDYKNLHGDPDLVKFKHKCRICNLDLILNLGVVKRHLRSQHNTSTASYVALYRDELEAERQSRPVVPPSHTLDGWWEGCLYRCRICQETYGGQLAFENHLTTAHNIIGQRDISIKYVLQYGKPCSLVRQHQCYVCRRIIRHDYKTIFTHLTKHNMDIETYTVEFRLLLEAELKEKGMNYIIAKALELESALTVEEYLKKTPRLDPGKLAAVDPMEGWFDCSEHRCAICDHVSWSNLRFHWHVKRLHGISSTKEYRRLHGDPEKTLRQHKCQICHSLIKWEASRIRDHLKFHRDPAEKISLKEYGERFKDYIIGEVIKFKFPQPAAENGDNVENTVAEVGEEGFNVQEWKSLFCKKVTPKDKVECNICMKVMNRHSFTRHQEKAHKGIMNVRDLRRMKKKQIQLAKNGVIKSLGELMANAGGRVVMRGKRQEKEQVDIKKEDMESRLNLYKAGLTLDQIESKSNLLHSGLTITKAAKVIERNNVDDTNEVTDELVEIEANEDEMSLYPTYIVDQNTGEILFVEEISGNQRVGISDAPDDFHTHCVEDSSKTAHRDESKNEDDSTTETQFKEDMSVWVVGSEESDIKECLEEEYEEEEDDEDGSMDGDGDTGPLDGRIMQILPDDTGGEDKDVCIAEDVVQIIQLNQEKEQDEDQDPVDGELGKEYVLEDGVLREIGGQGEAWQVEELAPDQEDIVMFTENGEEQGDSATFHEEFVFQSVEERKYMIEEERMGEHEQAPCLVLQEVQEESLGQQDVEEVTESNQYIQEETEARSSCCDPPSDNLTTPCLAIQVQRQSSVPSRLVSPSKSWAELGGGDQEYERKFISKSVVEHTVEGNPRRVSQGTVICSWTKMPGARVRVANSKVIVARKAGEQCNDRDLNKKICPTQETTEEKTIEAVTKDISEAIVYSSNGAVWRDVGCQVMPHKVLGHPTNWEEEQREARRVEEFLEMGGILDRSCPGCGKVMSRQRNLVTHLKVIHGVTVTGKEGEEHDNRYIKENIKLECDVCKKLVSRKSIKRHVSLCHPNSNSCYTKTKSKME